MNKVTDNIKSMQYNLESRETAKNLRVYKKFINWVVGEFDLYLMHESDKLKVYFPNGFFTIGGFKNENESIYIEIIVKGKSKITCKIFLNKILSIYNHVVQIQEVENQ